MNRDDCLETLLSQLFCSVCDVLVQPSSQPIQPYPSHKRQRERQYLWTIVLIQPSCHLPHTKIITTGTLVQLQCLPPLCCLMSPKNQKVTNVSLASVSSKTDCDDCRSQFEKESYPNLKANTLTTCIPIQLSYNSLYIVTGVHQSLEIEGIFRFMVGGYLWIHPKSVFAKLRSPILSNPPAAPLWTEHIHHGSNFFYCIYICPQDAAGLPSNKLGTIPP